ncbi:hypothetical protein [Actinophytocola sp.]|uniref:hypothetical protein n=1 Tax=Actinophytocola sp. TaxID=1872138 RepID=UPI00345B650F
MTEAGPPAKKPALARPYSWTEGRTEPSVTLAVEARVRTTPEGQTLPERRASAL